MYEGGLISSVKSMIECILLHTPYFRLIAYFFKIVYEMHLLSSAQIVM